MTVKNDSCHPEDPGQDYIDCPHCGAGRIYAEECDCCGWRKGDPAPERRRRARSCSRPGCSEPFRDNLDGDDLCQKHCDEWVRGERPDPLQEEDNG